MSIPIILEQELEHIKNNLNFVMTQSKEEIEENSVDLINRQDEEDNNSTNSGNDRSIQQKKKKSYMNKDQKDQDGEGNASKSKASKDQAEENTLAFRFKFADFYINFELHENCTNLTEMVNQKFSSHKIDKELFDSILKFLQGKL